MTIRRGRRIPTAIQVLNYALERATIDDKVATKPLEGSGSKSKEVKVKTTIKLPKEKKAELINTRILLTR